MPKSKILYFGIFAILIACAIFVVALLQEKATLISAVHLKEITAYNLPARAKVKGAYLYFWLDGKAYKVARESVNLQEFGEKVPLEIQEEASYFDKILEIAIVLMAFFLILAFLSKFLSKNPPKEETKLPRQKQMGKLLAEDAFDLYRIQPITSCVTFDDVAGISEAKEELEEIIDYLKSPKKYQDFGIRLPKGVLLIGPPGVGKTLIVKALAGEAGVPFFYQSGASFVQIYVGMGAKKVHDLFTKAKLNTPSIIFIDEIDAVGKARGGMRNDERETTLNQLLTEMDGFEESNGIIVIGATNNIESMDEALLRSGRFDRRIFIELPNLQERIKILKVHTRDKKCDFDYEEVAKLCVGFSGAALASLINESALCAIKRNSPIIQKEDILNVRDKVIVGVKKRLSFDEKEKEILALYQAAKAFSAYWLGIPFEKVTLMNDGLKYIEKEFLGKNDLENQIKVHLSGIAALELVYQERYSHSKEDLRQSKIIANKMVESYGMGELLFGKADDIAKILEECKNERYGFFQNYQSYLLGIRAKLLTQEKLEYEEIGEIINGVF
ncbi:MAG: ATP-dependent metallopeptidase FtsH/Yme1/Tma family protein [Helicobacter sp.]|nr:ATP-dependent metallopeptidase FtsH/Yme1/Tma family protein [Helicobacter sp.]